MVAAMLEVFFSRRGKLEKTKNRLGKVSLISKKIEMKVNEYLPNLDVEAPV
jgi:hypothetical protein